jgi:MEMO1 family protein
LEIQLPFLQRVLNQPFRILPVMVRAQDGNITHPLGMALAKVLAGRAALLVASSDLSHFYTQETANQFDAIMLQQVAAFDPDGVLKAEDDGRAFACGRGAVAAVLWAARALGGDSVQVLNHATSGDITGDYERVVGYGAAVITRRYNGNGSIVS